MGLTQMPTCITSILRALRRVLPLRVILIGLSVSLALLSTPPVSTVFADPGDPESPPGQPSDPPPNKPEHPRLDSRLNKMVEQIGSLRTQDIASSAPVSIGDLVAVTVRLSYNSSSTVDFLKSVGAIVANIGADYIEAYIPVTVLVPLSERDGVLRIQAILPPTPAVTSQGTTIHRSPVWNTRGYTGDGIKVGVIDGGFNGYSALMGSELPSTVVARCYTAVGFFGSNLSSCESGTVHGTGVAEAIVDIAPDVSLYVANPLSKGDLQSTAAWMMSEGVQVINMSLGWSWDGPGDGTSPYTDSPLHTVDSAVQNGVVWVNAAGNHADGDNWYGAYSDADANGWLAFTSSLDYNSIWLSAGSLITVRLRWDDNWYSSSSDLDLYLYDYDNGWVLLEKGNDVQDGSAGQDPYETITYNVLSTGWYYLFVKHTAGVAPEWFQLDVWSGQDLSLSVSDHSIGNPGDSSNPGMLTVGAANWATPSTIETFSSRGPTMDGRIKPDIVGVDRGDSVSYGLGGFAGTSQASPHLAGLAALVRERFPTYTPQQVATYMKDNASGIGTVPNSTWGYGLAQMPLFEPTAPTDVTATSGAGLATVTWNAPLDDGGSTVTLYTITSNPGGVTATTTGTSVTVTGLTNGTAYTFTVTATNSIGTSPSSDSSNSVTTPTAPGTPTEVFAIPSDVSAVVAWTAPTSDGGSPITLYTVTSVPGGLTATTTSTSTTVTGLTQNTAYTFTVTATNAAGTSASSEASPLVITKLTNIWNVPSTSGWGLAALVAGMFAALVVFLTKIRPLTNARTGLSR